MNVDLVAQQAILLENIGLIDGRGNEIQSSKSVLIKEGIVQQILNAGEEVDEDSLERIDLTGKFLLPGLFDMHVHLATSPSTWDELDLAKGRLSIMLKNGITGVRDMAGDSRQLAYLARQTHLDEMEGPDVYFSALMAGPTFFVDPRTKASGRGMVSGEAPWMKAISDKTDIALAVAEAKGTGATGIKIYADLPGHLAQKIIQEAHRQNFLVWAHAAVIPGMPSDLVTAQIDGVSHATLLAWEAAKIKPTSGKQRYDDTSLDVENAAFKAVIREMADKEIYLDPTVAIYRGRDNPNIYENGIKATKAAFNAGVPLIIGTDRGINLRNFDGLPIINEMEALVKDVGISPVEVIKAATLNSAKFLRIEKSVGSIEVGKKANLLIVNENPLTDITNLSKVHSVYKNGKKIN